MIRRLALTLSLAALLPQAAPAQTPAPAAEPAPVAAPAPAPVAAPAPAPDKLTVDVGGWMVFNSFLSLGGFNANDLPRFATGPRGENSVGMSVRQSRVRAVLGLPADGLLGGAKLKGLVELDFMGGYVGAGAGAVGDQSLPIVRFRHGWVSASWKELGNLTLLVGQTWGIFEGPYFAQSLGHLAIPRFGGAGFLFRRAPQVRVSGDLGADLGLIYQVGLLAPIDSTTVAPAPSGNVSAGERSGVPNVEARVAAVYRPGKKSMAEVGLSAHWGQEKYLVGGANRTADSQGFALDAKLDLPMVTVVGAAFTGSNLNIAFSAAPGIVVGATDVTTVGTKGVWGQAQVTPVSGLTLLLGGGMESPDLADLAGAAATAVKRNGQVTGGVQVNLTSRWKCALELTRYVTSYLDASRFVSHQVELSTLYAF